jgi:hypothetical protein
VYEEEEEKTRP